MSRLEKKIHKKLKRRKIKVVFKVLFILAMITNLSICIFIIDKSAKDMLGTDAYLLNSFIDDINMDDIKVNIGEKINEISAILNNGDVIKIGKKKFVKIVL